MSNETLVTVINGSFISLVAVVALVVNSKRFEDMNKRLNDLGKRLDDISNRLSNLKGHSVSFAEKIARL